LRLRPWGGVQTRKKKMKDWTKIGGWRKISPERSYMPHHEEKRGNPLEQKKKGKEKKRLN